MSRNPSSGTCSTSCVKFAVDHSGEKIGAISKSASATNVILHTHINKVTLLVLSARTLFQVRPTLRQPCGEPRHICRVLMVPRWIIPGMKTSFHQTCGHNDRSQHQPKDSGGLAPPRTRHLHDGTHVYTQSKQINE